MAFSTRLGLKGGASAYAIVPEHAIIRLAGTCFRGQHKPLAGNFFKWGSVSEVISDRQVRTGLARHVDALLAKNEFGTHSATVELSEPIGWTGTDELSKFSPEELEEFRPNRKSFALRLKPERHDKPAPKTNLVTFVFQLKTEGKYTVIIIHSMYPGNDIGEMNGDISRRENIVFFDWNHPGA